MQQQNRGILRRLLSSNSLSVFPPPNYYGSQHSGQARTHEGRGQSVGPQEEAGQDGGRSGGLEAAPQEGGEEERRQEACQEGQREKGKEKGAKGQEGEVVCSRGADGNDGEEEEKVLEENRRELVSEEQESHVEEGEREGEGERQSSSSSRSSRSDGSGGSGLSSSIFHSPSPTPSPGRCAGEVDEGESDFEEEWSDLLEDMVDHAIIRGNVERELAKRKKALREKLRVKVMSGKATATECGLYNMEKAYLKKSMRMQQQRMDPCLQSAPPVASRRSKRGKNNRSYGHMRLRSLVKKQLS